MSRTDDEVIARASRAPRISRRLIAPPGGVAVRMYRQGLGDCFLLCFPGRKPGEPVYMLIDCGVHTAQPDGRRNLERILDDVERATGGHIHLVVATHEHTDHLSGFRHGARRFLNREITIDRLWLAWTEDENDVDAQLLRQNRTAAKRAIDEALHRLRERRARLTLAEEELAERLAAVSSFFETADDEDDVQAIGPWARRLGVADDARPTGNELALAVLRQCAETCEYLRPGGRPYDIPGTRDVRAYVLGPPLNPRLLRKSDPSSGHRQETYLNSAANLHSFAAAFERTEADSIDEAQVRLTQPFDSGFRLDYAQAAEMRFFRQHYGNGADPHEAGWRRIEEDWLFAAEQLALRLDQHTNNTSVALALEVGPPGTGPVLLFPADAQVGSWLSWQTLSWRNGRQEVHIADLFRRTVLLKVGHHASHNGTLRRDSDGHAYGLELIPDGLIAMLPVDEAAAGKLRGWDMPYARLYQPLKRKTCGNILRSDDGHDFELPIPRTRPEAVSGAAAVTKWCRSRAKKENNGGPLYYDLAIFPDD
jgi:hypothetical protein